MSKNFKSMLRRQISSLLVFCMMLSSFNSVGTVFGATEVNAREQVSNNGVMMTTSQALRIANSSSQQEGVVFKDITEYTVASTANANPVWVEENGVIKISGFYTRDSLYLDKTFEFNPNAEDLILKGKIKVSGAAGLVVGCSDDDPVSKMYFLQIAAGYNVVRFGALPWTGTFHKNIPISPWDNTKFHDFKVTVADGLITFYINDVEIGNIEPDFDFSGYIGLYHHSGSTEYKEVQYALISKSDEEFCNEAAGLVTKDVIAPSSVYEAGKLKSNLTLNAVQIPSYNKSTVSWSSSNPDLISNTGQVTIISQANNNVDANPNVTMTATISCGDTTVTKSFNFVVFKEQAPIVFTDMTNFTVASTGTGTPVWVEENGVYKISGHYQGDSLYLDKTFQFDPINYNLIFKGKIKLDGAAGVVVGCSDDPKNKMYFIQMVAPRSLVRFGALPWPGSFHKELSNIQWNSSEFQDYKLTVENNRITYYLNGNQIHSREADFDFSGYIGLFHYNGYTEYTQPQYALVEKTDEEYCQGAADAITQQIIAPPSVFDDYSKLKADLSLNEYTTDTGCQVTWSSSNTKVITNQGVVKVICEDNNNMDEDPNVTITAHITKGYYTMTKDFNFTVQRFEGTNLERINGDLSRVTLSSLIGQNVTSIIHSIDLPRSGQQGSQFAWSSSNTEVITNGGHVFRPKFDEGNQTVTMSLTATIGQTSVTKNFNITVKADPVFTDPDRMSDEDFFGKHVLWWTKKGVLDYTIPELKTVQDAARDGNYTLAKERLLAYMQSKPLPDHYFNQNVRDTPWASSIIAGIHTLQGNNYFAGAGKSTNITDMYQPVEIPIYTHLVNKGGKTSLSVEGKYNETSKLIVASKEAGSALAPKVVITVNGEERSYPVEVDTLVSSKNPTANYGNETEMPVYFFGRTLNADNNKAKMRFSFPDLVYQDEITAAKLVINCKVTPAFAGEKEFMVIKEPSNTWAETSTSWNSFTGYIYNFNGIENGNHWNNIPGSDAEYRWQAPRFLHFDAVAAEYAATKDEDYAYYAVQTMLDFIKDKADTYPRSLDVAERVQRWTRTLDEIILSPYMTPEALTAILKSYYKIFDYLPTTTTSINWKHNELDRMIRAIYVFPIFKRQQEWINVSVDGIDKIGRTNLLANGSYIEATAGYSWGAYKLFTEFKDIVNQNGKQISADLDSRLEKGAYYALMLRYPDARWLQYGDCPANQDPQEEQFPKLYEWYGNAELQYIDSFGQKGTKPDWTSMKFEDSKSIMMRSDWTTNSLYNFSQVRGGGHHSHLDDNLMNAYAYGRILLTDAGIFTYTSSDPLRRWGTSTKAHNTVEIDGYSQNNRSRDNPIRGSIDHFLDNGAFSFARLTSKSYKNYYHQRNTTLNKEGFWIVSDYMTPFGTKANSATTYKQIWHMLPYANLSIDGTNNTMQSNFAKGPNIILANADRGAIINTRTADGYYDYNYQVVTESKYAYFEAPNKVGKTSIDTLIFPTPDGGATATSQRINIGVASNVATAMGFSYTLNNEVTNGYYMLDYVHNLNTERNLNKYATNAKMLTVLEKEDGAVKQVSLVDGHRVKDQAGNLLVNSSSVLSDLAYTVEGTTLEVETNVATGTIVSNVTMYIPQSITKVTLNGEQRNFTKVDNTLRIN